MRVTLSLKARTLFDWRPYQYACLCASLFPFVIALACWQDGTWSMGSGGRGFSQHYGFWAMFSTTPAMVLLTAYLWKTFVASIGDIDGYCTNLTEGMRARATRLVRRHLDSLLFRSRSVWLFAFLEVVLLFWWLFNVLKTISPVTTYGHDVFDSYGHPFGFYSTKLYSLLLFSLVYSVAIFVSLHITVSLISILKFAARHDILRINLFHADNCAGTSKFGNINLLILAIYANFFIVDYAMYLTHRRTYLAVVAALGASCILAVLQSVAAVYYIHTAVAQKKQEVVDAMAVQLNSEVAASLKHGGRFPSDLLAIRDRLIEVHTYPYAAEALVAVNTIRLAPAVVALITYFRG